MTFTLAKSAALALLLALPFAASAQLQITEIMYNPVGNDAVYEWFEVRNIGATAIDLNGYQIEGVDDLYRESFSRTISNALDPTTTIGPGQVAVVYDGFVSSANTSYNNNDDTFREVWGIPASVPVIAGDFFPDLSNSGKGFGLWADNASILLDSVPGETVPADRTVTGYANAAAGITYGVSSPWPTSSDAFSIQWTGNGDPNDGANWYRSEAGGAGVRTSLPIIDLTGGFKNSPNDLGNPGIVQGTPPAAPGLIISEVMYNPTSATPAESDWEWVEIYNNTGAPIDFSATPYVIDDDDDNALAAANLTSGLIPAGETAVLFSGNNTTLADMQTAWGASVNLIPFSGAFTGFANGGDRISIWDSLSDYTSEPVTTGSGARTFQNAAASVLVKNNTEGWPDDNGTSSIYLSDLSADSSVGSNWLLSGNLNDFDSYNATGIPLSSITRYEGGDLASPGEFTALTTPDLPGDYNGDLVVDVADYTVWRDGNSPDDTIAGYNLWAANYGATSASSSIAVPEPATMLTIFGALACVAGFRRR
jgi:hypothetical protein